MTSGVFDLLEGEDSLGDLVLLKELVVLLGLVDVDGVLDEVGEQILIVSENLQSSGGVRVNRAATELETKAAISVSLPCTYFFPYNTSPGSLTS